MADEEDAQWFTLSTMLQYFDTFEQLAIRDCNNGGAARSVIIAADVTFRQEWQRLKLVVARRSQPPIYAEFFVKWGGNGSLFYPVGKRTR